MNYVIIFVQPHSHFIFEDKHCDLVSLFEWNTGFTIHFTAFIFSAQMMQDDFVLKGQTPILCSEESLYQMWSSHYDTWTLFLPQTHCILLSTVCVVQKLCLQNLARLDSLLDTQERWYMCFNIGLHELSSLHSGK